MRTHVQDRRRDPRVTHWSPLIVGDGESSRPATLQNLSLAGVGCTSSVEYALGRSVRVLLELPQAEGERDCLDLPAQVVRCLRHRRSTARPRYNLGLVFGDLDEEQSEKLKNFIRGCLDDKS